MSVVGTKLGTKTWSEAPQNEIQKSTGNQTRSAADTGPNQGEDVGSILNKIADPNFVDPSKKMRAVGNDKMDKDAFMKLMLAQMKNQDPTNPMKSHEMAAQLAQFSGLEQMQNMNTTLSDIKTGQKPSENFQALNFIGKAVTGDSAKISRMKGDKDHEFAFELPDDAKSVSIKIKNAGGDILRKIDLQNLKKGANKISWNGKDDRGATAPIGEYQFAIEATNSAAKKMAVKTDFNGLITGVNYTPEGPVLLVGSQSIRMKDVKKIVDPNVQANLALGQIQDSKTQGLQTQNGAKDTGKVGVPGGFPGTQNSNRGPALSPGAEGASMRPLSGAVPEADDEGAQDAPQRPMAATNLENIGMTPMMADKLKKESTLAPPEPAKVIGPTKPMSENKPPVHTGA